MHAQGVEDSLARLEFILSDAGVNPDTVGKEIRPHTHLSTTNTSFQPPITGQYVCVCIFRHILTMYPHTLMYPYTYTHTHTHKYGYIYKHIHICLYTYIYIYIYLYIYIYICIYIYVYLYLYISIYIYMQASS